MTCHPSVDVVGSLFGDCHFEIAKKVQSPQMVLVTPVDSPYWFPRGKIHKLLEAVHPQSEVHLYKQMHGFVARGHMQSGDVQCAIRRVVTFFKSIRSQQAEAEVELEPDQIETREASVAS